MVLVPDFVVRNDYKYECSESFRLRYGELFKFRSGFAQ